MTSSVPRPQGDSPFRGESPAEPKQNEILATAKFNKPILGFPGIESLQINSTVDEPVRVEVVFVQGTTEDEVEAAKSFLRITFGAEAVIE